MAPEILQPNAKSTAKVDVFSLALVMYEFMTGRTVVGFDADLGLQSFPQDFSSRVQSLLQHGAHKDPSWRPNLQEFERILGEEISGQDFLAPVGYIS